MNIPFFIHESSDSAPLAVPVFGSPGATRPQGDRPPMRAAAAEAPSAACAASTGHASHLHFEPATNQPAAAASAPEQSVIYRFDQADYAALARRYSALLRQALSDETRPTDQHAFCRRMLEELERTLTKFRTISGRQSVSDARFDAEMELQWLCNQCEGFFGAAVASELDTSRLNANAPAADPATTDAELVAISFLFAIGRAAAGRSIDRAAWLHHGGGAMSILGHQLREALARTVAWLRRHGAAVKAIIRRTEQRGP